MATDVELFNAAVLSTLQAIQLAPTYYARGDLFTTAKTTVMIPAGMRLMVGGKFLTTTSAKSLALSTVGTASALAGKDVYIYAVQPSSGWEASFVLSLNSTVPTGYTASNSRKIGGFHCLCASVGTISGHNLSGYVQGDIIPYTRWDLIHRPVCESEGMTYVEPMGVWVQIYLPSWDGSKLVSRYGGVIVDGSSSKKMGGEEFAYYAGLSGCSLIKRDQFVVAARGSNEQTNISGSSDPNTTGGHSDTAGRRMISNWGVEDCCGVIWQWGADCFEYYPGTTWNGSNLYLTGYSWQTASVSNSSFETGMGSCIGLLRRVRLGAHWGDGSDCGSRAAACYGFSSGGGSAHSGRLASEPRVVNL